MPLTPPVIDAHQHVWDPRRARYDWLDETLHPIDRPIGFDELRPALAAAGVDATVLVQSADDLADTALMIETAQAAPQVAAVVAYAPLDRPDEAEGIIARYAADPLIVGVRTLIHNQPDPDWLLSPEVDAGLGMLAAAGLTFDVVAVLPRHLELVPLIGERHPDLRMVIDHLAKPPIGLVDREPWWTLIAAAAENPLVHAKVSGLYSATEDTTAWTPELIRPFFDRAVDVFGVERLMYGGDWPISVLAGGYARVWDGLAAVTAHLGGRERAEVYGGTAARFYGISPTLLARAARAASQSSDI